MIRISAQGCPLRDFLPGKFYCMVGRCFTDGIYGEGVSPGSKKIEVVLEVM